MRLMRTLTATAAAVSLILLTGASASAARPTARPAGSQAVGHLIRQHDCVRYGQPVSWPIKGYLVRDIANPNRGLFYKDSGSFTSGQMVGWGGTLELRYQCRR